MNVAVDVAGAGPGVGVGIGVGTGVGKGVGVGIGAGVGVGNDPAFSIAASTSSMLHPMSLPSVPPLRYTLELPKR